jgi:hypothetical protein
VKSTSVTGSILGSRGTSRKQAPRKHFASLCDLAALRATIFDPGISRQAAKEKQAGHLVNCFSLFFAPFCGPRFFRSNWPRKGAKDATGSSVLSGISEHDPCCVFAFLRLGGFA